MNRRALDRLFAVVGRELTTVVRTRAYVALAVSFALIVGGLAWTANTVGYVPLVLDLLTPVEVLVVALAVAFGYRAVLGDRERGELDVVRTYPVSRPTFVLGVYLGRASALLVAVLVPLAAVAVLVPVFGGVGTGVIASHAGTDSPAVYARFVALTALFTLVVAAAAVAVSAAARTGRSGLALAVTLGLALAVGFDAGILAGLAGGAISEGALQWLLALSPNSAYRGLVLETVVGGVGETGVPTASPAASALGLVGWLAGTLAVAVQSVWRATDQ
jgi:ABC-2 type transport system permease protein